MIFKVLRLGFHDCIPHANATDGEVIGCDGCLNPDGMGIDMMEYYNTDKNQFNGPDVTLTNNNGGFQLEFVSVSRVINHMTCDKFECSHWWKIYFEKKILYKICSPV